MYMFYSTLSHLFHVFERIPKLAREMAHQVRTFGVQAEDLNVSP